MTDIVLKTCKECKEELPRDENFYKAGKYWQARCKPCHNKSRTSYKRWVAPKKPKKPRAFQALSFENRCSVIKKINDGVGLKDIAQEHDIKYETLRRWKRDGKLIIKIDTKELSQ